MISFSSVRSVLCGLAKSTFREKSVPARMPSCHARPKTKEANGNSIRLCANKTLENLECPHVLGLPALRSFGHVELHGLTFLQALEPA